MNIPSEIWIQIMLSLDALSLRTLSQVSKMLYKVSQEQKLWQRLCLLDATDLNLIGDVMSYKDLYVLGYRNRVRIMRLDFITNRISRELLFDISRLDLNRAAPGTKIATSGQEGLDTTRKSVRDTILESSRALNSMPVISRSTSLYGYETNGTRVLNSVDITLRTELNSFATPSSSTIIPRIIDKEMPIPLLEPQSDQTGNHEQVFKTWEDYSKSKKSRQRILFNWISDCVIVEQ